MGIRSSDFFFGEREIMVCFIALLGKFNMNRGFIFISVEKSEWRHQNDIKFYIIQRRVVEILELGSNKPSQHSEPPSKRRRICYLWTDETRFATNLTAASEYGFVLSRTIQLVTFTKSIHSRGGLSVQHWKIISKVDLHAKICARIII